MFDRSRFGVLLLLLLPWASARSAGIHEELRLEHAIDAAIAARTVEVAKASPGARGAAGPGRIHGQVFDADDGLPVADAEVRLHPFGRFDVLTNPSVRTDSAGAFEFTGLDSGYYMVSASGVVGAQQPYQAEVFPNAGCGPACRDVWAGQVLVAGLDNDPAGLVINLDKGASIAGTLTSDVDSPMRLGLVVVYDENRLGVGTAYGDIVGAGTDAIDYRMDGLPPGKYFMAIRARPPVGISHYRFVARSPSGDDCGLGACMQEADSFELAYGEQRTGMDFALTDWPGVAGPDYGVTVPDGQPDEVWSTLSFHSPSGQLTGWTTEYSTRPGTPDYFSMRPAYVFKTILSDHRVVAEDTSRIENDGLRHYRDRVFPDIDCGPLLCDPAAGSTPAPGTVVMLTPAGSIRGTVRDRGLGRTLPGARVAAYSLEGALVTWTRSREDGSYELAALPDGSFRIVTENEFGLTDGAWPGIRCNGACSPGTGAPVLIDAAGTVSGIDLVVGGGYFVGDFE